MKVECIPLTSFAHGSINAHEGKALMLDERLADDLERAGLIRVKRARPMAATAEVADAGKPQAAGEAQQSSVSPAAPASPMTTAPKSGRGGKRAKRGA